MNPREIAKDVIFRHGGISKTADLVAAGLEPTDIAQICHAGYLDRVCHGYYQLTQGCADCEEHLRVHKTLIEQMEVPLTS